MFFDCLPPAVAAEFEQLGGRRRYGVGEALFLEGDRAGEVLLLLSGEVKISVGSVEGREVILDVLEPGSLIGELSAIDGEPRSATVMALSPVEVLAVAAEPFNRLLDRHPDVLRRLLLEVIRRLRVRVRHQLEFGAGDALGRICARLAELAGRYGQAEEDGGVVIRSPVSQSELAAWTGLSREAVVKALRALRQLGWIENRGRKIIIRDVESVQDRATR
jgi:CRP-like cAMP-binding protein